MGCPLNPQEHNTLIFTDASNQGWGADLENMTVSGNWTEKEITSYQCPRVKGSVSGLKKLSKNSRQKASDSNRPCHCSQLSEQTRGNTLLGHVSPGLVHLGLLQSSKYTHSGLPQCHSRQSLQEGQNNSNRMVSSSSNIQPSLAKFGTNQWWTCLPPN